MLARRPNLSDIDNFGSELEMSIISAFLIPNYKFDNIVFYIIILAHVLETIHVYYAYMPFKMKA